MTEASRANTQTRDSHDTRSFSPSASINESTPRGLMIVLSVCGVLGLMFGFAAIIIATLAERESRIMQDDLKYIRAYLSARGIHIPADHDEAEDNQSGPQNHH